MVLLDQKEAGREGHGGGWWMAIEGRDRKGEWTTWEGFRMRAPLLIVLISSSPCPPLMDLLPPNSGQNPGLSPKFSSKKCFICSIYLRVIFFGCTCISTINTCCWMLHCISSDFTLHSVFFLPRFLPSTPSAFLEEIFDCLYSSSILFALPT